MRTLTLSIAILLFFGETVFSQSGFSIHASTGIITEVKGETGSDITEIKVVLPDKNFQQLRININNRLALSFDCNANLTKDTINNCVGLYAQDIQKGQVLLRFKGRKLESISGRTIFSGDTVLNINTNSISFSGVGTVTNPFSFTSAAIKNEGKEKNKPAAVLIVCEKKDTVNRTSSGLANFSFLCLDSLVFNKKCFCGIPVKNAYENMYLPPCFDKDGNAVSVRYHVLYDMSQTDPMRKVFLFETVRKSWDSGECENLPYTGFEFASIRRRLRPRAGDILAVSIIAHKDSSIVIDSSNKNFFLDSAQSVQNAFTAAGNKTQPANPQPEYVSETKNRDSVIKGVVTLQGDLLYFNNYFRGGNFIQAVYIKQLICLQQNISNFFRLQVIPKSGRELAEALDKKITENRELISYYAFACSLLTQLIAEYDTALSHVSNYRVYTQLMQVPNEDELGIGIATKTHDNLKYLYRHDFLVSGGLKLDFSTGVFATGLDSRDFSIRSTQFTFRDSLTGSTRDTTGNLIAANRKKININTGFLVHVYPRSGRYVNAGLVAGVTFNNSQFMFLAGASIMFRMGNARLSFVGGFAFGREKELDVNQQQYVYNEDRTPPTRIYNQDNRPGQVVLADRLPRFLPEPNITTYDKRKGSLFAGITYNFASIKL